jgi:hypothetical protein
MKCFIIMPFGNPDLDSAQFDKLNSIYSDWIKNTIENIDLSSSKEKIICYRANEEFHSGEIISHIIENLINSDLVIADLTGKNPNVFYELGVRHAVKNNTILISEEINDIPFDLRHLRTISYKYTPDKMLKFKKELEETVKTIFSQPEKIDNPVRRYLYDSEAGKILSNPQPPGFDFYKIVLTEMNQLKIEIKNQFLETQNLVNSLTESRMNNSNQVIKDLSLLEGHWINSEIGSNYYPKIINNELFIPYCYGGNSHLTAHFYKCRLVGNVLFGKFEWFNSEIKGIAFFKLIENDKMEGGWWYFQDLPFHALNDFNLLDERIPKMNKITLKKLKSKELPKWVKDYYALITKKGIYYKNEGI